MTFIVDAEWIILGASTANGRVVLAASDDLSMGEIRDALGLTRSGTFTQETEIAATARHVRIVEGADYAEALRLLFAEWTPGQPARGEIGERLALPQRRGGTTDA